MAICSDFLWQGITIPSAYIRVDYIYGGKRTPQVTAEVPYESHWTATVGLYSDSTQHAPFAVIDAQVPYVADVSPYPALYESLKSNPQLLNPVDC